MRSIVNLDIGDGELSAEKGEIQKHHTSEVLL